MTLPLSILTDFQNSFTAGFPISDKNPYNTFCHSLGKLLHYFTKLKCSNMLQICKKNSNKNALIFTRTHFNAVSLFIYYILLSYYFKFWLLLNIIWVQNSEDSHGVCCTLLAWHGQ